MEKPLLGLLMHFKIQVYLKILNVYQIGKLTEHKKYNAKPSDHRLFLDIDKQCGSLGQECLTK